MNALKDIAATVMTFVGIAMFVGDVQGVDQPWTFWVKVAGVAIGSAGIDWKIRRALKASADKNLRILRANGWS